MRDRHELEALLIRRFPGSSREQVASAANAIMAMTEQWESEEKDCRRTDSCLCEVRPAKEGRGFFPTPAK